MLLWRRSLWTKGTKISIRLNSQETKTKRKGIYIDDILFGIGKTEKRITVGSKEEQARLTIFTQVWRMNVQKRSKSKK